MFNKKLKEENKKLKERLERYSTLNNLDDKIEELNAEIKKLELMKGEYKWYIPNIEKFIDADYVKSYDGHIYLRNVVDDPHTPDEVVAIFPDDYTVVKVKV